MSLEENKAIVRKVYEAFNERNTDMADEIIAPDYVDYTNQIQGLESGKKFMTMFWEGFPDIYWSIEDIIAEGDKVWVRAKITGTHTGEYRGLAPTGKKFTISAVDIWHVVNGKIVECWAVDDWMDCFKQLGVIEITEKGKQLFPEDVK